MEHKDFEHGFIRENADMLRKMFGSHDLMPFWLADMEFQVAEPITAELERIAGRAMYAYEYAADAALEAIVQWNRRRNNLNLEARFFVQITGVLAGIALLIRELCKEDEAVLIQTPVYHQFARIIKGAERRIVRNPLRIASGKYEMDFDDLEEKLARENVKIILLCNPHNPVGRVWKADELARLVELADSHGAVIISDEIHSDIIYTGNAFTSIASFGPSRHIALLGSPAKTFGLMSIAGGYIYISDAHTRNRIKNTVSTMHLNHGNAFSVYGTIAAYNQGEPWLNEMLAYLEQTLAWIQDHLERELPAVLTYTPEGTYQIWMDFAGLGLTGDEIQSTLVHEARLALTPGQWFDEHSSTFMRMNIAVPLSRVKIALERMTVAFRDKA